MIDLSIIIVNYNVKEFILNLLASLQPALKDISSEIIVVDNDSEDNSVEAIRSKHPEVILVENKKNLGFGAANNIGLEKSTGKYILFLNPDTIVRQNTFSTMIKFFEENPSAGLAGCKILNPDGSLQLPCRRSFPGPWTSFTKLTGLSTIFPKSKLFAKYNLTYLDENETYEVDAVSGAFMMIRREVYDKIGGFDPIFFMYGEDLDLCYRTQKEGYKVFYVHSTEIIHYKGESTKRSTLDETNVFYKAMQLFVKKHLSSSIIVQLVLRLAIVLRKIFAFANLYKLVIVPVFLDLLFFILSIRWAESIYSNERWIGFPESVLPGVYIFPAIFQVAVSLLSGAYKKNTLSVLRILSSLLLGFVLLAFITFFLKQYAFSRAVLLISYIIVVVLFTVWRIVSKLIFKFGLSDVARKTRTLLVGFGDSAETAASKLRANINSYQNLIGLVELSKIDIGKKIGPLEIIGTLDTLKRVIIEKRIDEVIFNADSIGYEKMFASIADCQGTNVEFLVTGHGLDFMVGKSIVTMFDDMSLLKINYNISSPLYRLTKNVFDLIFSFILTVTLYPIVAIMRFIFRLKGNLSQMIMEIPKVLIFKKSFVGPQENSEPKDLFLGRSGITGLWFVEDLTNKTSEDVKKLNIFYAKNYNIWLDLEILGKTFSKIFLGR